MSEDPLDRPATPEEIEMVERQLKQLGRRRMWSSYRRRRSVRKSSKGCSCRSRMP